MSSSLLKLQHEWYQKLKESGFNDIENHRGQLTQHNIRTIAYENQDFIRDFFTHLGHFLSHTSCLSDLHRTILTLYCDGVHIKKIAIQVQKTDRTVRSIISVYREKILRGSSSRED